MDTSTDSYMTKEPRAEAVTRAELALIRGTAAFTRWSLFLHKSVSNSQLSAPDICLLHSIRMCGGAQNLSELLLFLNRNDVSTLQYSLKKIEQWGLIERVTGNSKREAGYRLTEEGMAVTEAYSAARDELLLPLIADVSGLVDALDQAAASFERLTGIFDQATQSVLNRRILGKGAAQE